MLNNMIKMKWCLRTLIVGTNMKIYHALSIASLILLGACAKPVTEGDRVFITPSDSAHLPNCKMLGQVEVDAKIFGKFTQNQQVQEIKNRLRDEAARRYPTADTVTHSDINVSIWKGPDSNIMGTAFNCFKK